MPERFISDTLTSRPSEIFNSFADFADKNIMQSAKAIANYFLDLAQSENKELSPMKIQKLVYFAHGWYLGLTGKMLIDEQVEAWTYGPVISSLYHEFKEFGNNPITRKACRFSRVGPGEALDFTVHEPSLSDSSNKSEIQPLLDRIWETYGSYTAIQLSNLTHEDGTPWSQVMEEMGAEIIEGTDIPREAIRAYFQHLADKNSKRQESGN